MKRRTAIDAAFRGRRWLPIVVASLAFSLSACDATLLQITGGVPFFPADRREGPRPMMAARSSGTLTLENNCLWLRSGRERHLIIWPASNHVEWRQGQLVVVTGTDTVVARVGDEIAMGGGEWRTEDAVVALDLQVEAMIGQPVPPACREGLYWIGAVIDDGR